MVANPDQWTFRLQAVSRNLVRHRQRLAGGFTLLELVLTLAMSVVLMALIGGAVQFYGRDMNLRDMDVRQTQLAAALIQMIENDLRSCVFGEPTDMQPLEELLVATSGGDGGESDEDLSAAGIESDDAPFADDVLDTDLLTSATVLQSPGMIGDSTSLQIDLSRLPRLEEYQVSFDATIGNLEDIPSDLKTVTYYVQAAGTIAGVQDQLESVTSQATTGTASTLPSGTSVAGGLVRRSLDRSGTVYATESGGLTALSQSGDLLAPEVTAITFEYFDGTNWLTYWNSDEFDQLPFAVRVQISMEDVSSIEDNAVRQFTHVVQIPLARPAETDDTADADLAGAGL
jgi:type II secretory pathway pseudopilin PulG